MAAISEELLERLVMAGLDGEVRLEMTAGMPTWEPTPGRRHQRISRSVADSARRASGNMGDCGCHSILDVYVRFADGSFRSPDVAIYCQEPPDVDGALDVLPVAVVEIVNEGYERKDEIGLPFYLAQSIADVVLYDPRKNEVVHATSEGQTVHQAPVDLDFACGCTVTIPL